VTFNDSIPTTEYPAVVDNCISINETGCNEALRAKLPAHVATSRTAIGYVLRLPFKALITTNFDPWIRQQSRMEKYKVTHVYPHLPLNDGLGNRIYYIHGFFDSEEPTSSIVKLVLGKK